MPKTISQIINYVDETVPNAIASTTKQLIIADIWKELKEYNSEYVVSDTTPTASSQKVYSLPTGVAWKDLIYVGVSATTYASTTLPLSTTPFTEYRYKAEDNEEIGNQWYEYTSSSICIIAVPDNAYYMRFKYVPSLVMAASSDLTVPLLCSINMVYYIQHKLSSIVARSGAFPRIDLANNYELDAMESLSKIKIDAKKLRWSRLKSATSYKAWW